jgi:L-serine dehydratase
MNIPSIFNDVIDPVMRGPSSSHCAAALRIGKMARDLMAGKIEEVTIEFDSKGSLATTHKSQGSDMGLFGGLLGLEATDERLPLASKLIDESGIIVKINISEFGYSHSNTYYLILKNKTEQHQIKAISSGGGMIEVIEIDGLKVSICGDFFETLIFCKKGYNAVVNFLNAVLNTDLIIIHQHDDFIEVKTGEFIPEEIIHEIEKKFQVQSIRQISPVLPVLSRKTISVPYQNCNEMLEYNQGKDLELWKLALEYESIRGNISKEQGFDKMKEIVNVMQGSIATGLAGTSYKDRILGNQSGEFQSKLNDGQLLDAGLLNQMILNITAIMECKSSMGVIVAAPTAGSCGTLPGTITGAAEVMGLSIDEIVKAMLAGGMIGIFIATRSTFAAEVCGCQAECGAASGMTAAGLVTLAGGTTQQAINAASMALQNTMGMTCDPVANRVEVPCLGKNIMAASNALSCANTALANFNPVIPLDEVIETMDKVGKSLPSELRCTALGGLSVCKTSKDIEERLRSD